MNFSFIFALFVKFTFCILVHSLTVLVLISFGQEHVTVAILHTISVEWWQLFQQPQNNFPHFFQTYIVVLLLLYNTQQNKVNLLTPNVNYSGLTAPLTSKVAFYIYIYSTNIGTEYFKHGIYSPFFSLQNAVCFIILTYLVPVLFTFL